MLKQIRAEYTPAGLRVVVPYGSQWTARLKAAGARWDAAGRAWVVPTEAADAVLGTLRGQFGSVDASDWATVELRPVHEICAQNIYWGPWWLASGRGRFPEVAGVLTVHGKMRTVNEGSRNNPRFAVVLSPETAIRLNVPRDWFSERNAAVADDGWIVAEVQISTPAPTAAPTLPKLAPDAPTGLRPMDLESIPAVDLLREVRRRAALAMDEARRTPGTAASIELDKIGTLLAAIEGVL